MLRSFLAFSVAGLVSVSANAKGTGNTAECLAAKDRYFANVDMDIRCETYAHKYQSNVTPVNADAAAANSHQILIGQFNLLRLGEDSSKFKDFGLLAKIMNQWDVVGAVELTPTSNIVRRHNDGIAAQNNEALKSSFLIPSHIRLLLALQQLDPSWSLIMSAEARGDGSEGELAGFYYRATRLTLALTNYCVTVTGAADAGACTAQYAPDIDPLISRPAFISTFLVGGKPFTLLTTHLRYSASVEESQALLKIFPGRCGLNCKAPQPYLPRMAEARVTAELMAALEKSEQHAVIWGGDFNFSASNAGGSSLTYILDPLDGGQMLNNALSTLSTQEGLASSYDHFVLGKSSLSICDVDSVKPFDFRDPALLPEIQDYQANADTLFQKFALLWDQQMTVKKKDLQKLMTPQKIEAMTAEFDKRIRNPNHPNQFYEAILSDHLPISMSCQIQ